MVCKNGRLRGVNVSFVVAVSVYVLVMVLVECRLKQIVRKAKILLMVINQVLVAGVRGCGDRVRQTTVRRGPPIVTDIDVYNLGLLGLFVVSGHLLVDVDTFIVVVGVFRRQVGGEA